VQDGACTREAVREALQNQVIFGGRLGTNLLELGAVTEEVLARTLGRRHGVPFLSGEMRLDPAAVRLLRPELADRHDAVPYVLADRRLAILVCDPSDLAMLDEVAFATGKQVHAMVAAEARIWALLREAYGIDRQLRGIEVDFGRAAPPSAQAATRAPSDEGPDLMDQEEFDALYGRVGVPPAGEEPILDLTDEVSDLPATAAAGPAPRQPGGEPGVRPPARVVVPGPRAEEPEPSPLGFEEALRFLEGVTERGAIGRTVLRYARSRFKRALLLTVNRGLAQGWAGMGEGLSAAAVRAIRLPLGSPGIVDTVVRSQAHFLGPIPRTDANVRLLKALGGGVPRNAFLVPVLALGRVVNVLYADAGRGGLVDGDGAGELLILAARIARSYDELLARVR
jgi:hypothetical protein